MYAVIKTGGKQYKVAAGEKIKVEQIAADVGQEIVIDQVLAVGERRGAEDRARLGRRRQRQGHGRGPRPARQGAHLQDAPPQALPEAQGHRQNFTELEIGAVNGLKPAAIRSLNHGTEKRRRLDPERPRFAAEDARRQGVRRPGRSGRLDHRAPARHQVPCRHQRRHRQGPHAVRAGRRPVSASRSRARSNRQTVERRRRPDARRAPSGRRSPGAPGLFRLRCHTDSRALP